MTAEPPPAADPSATSESDETRDVVRAVLEAEIAQVDSPEAAEAVVQQVEQLAAGTTEAQAGQAAATAPTPAPVAVTQAAEAGERVAPSAGAADALAEAAAQAVAPAPTAPAVVEAAQSVLAPAAISPHPPPEVRRGRRLLREATLRRLGPLQRLDARIFLTINGFPHPRWSDRLANGITIWATGGWIWAAGLLVTRVIGVHRSWRPLGVLLPSTVLSTWIVEYPIKMYFRRRRPFIDIVRALVVGKRPGSWSFPSGHTAASFAGATALTAIWPRRAPLFYALASTVGISRVYVGAHYPGDVLSGAVAGTVLSEFIRRLTLRFWPGLRT
jgi:undecaprenyl-diphosphatase